MFGESLPAGASFKDIANAMTPLGSASPDEVAATIAHIASDDARYMTGSIVSFDGGLTDARWAAPSARRMFDDEGTSGSLIERRADATPERIMLYRGDRS